MEQARSRMLSKLESVAEVTPAERRAIEGLPLTMRRLAPGDEVVREGDRPSNCCLLVEGFMHRYLVVSDGARQIVSIHTPGDIPDIQSLHLGTMDHTLAATTECVAAFITHQDINKAIARTPELGSLLWRDSLIDAAIFRRWITELGRHTAVMHMAHLFCELFLRLQAVGLTDGNTCRLPFTQELLGDALGLSTVHTNRSLQALRQEGLVDFDGARLAIPDWDALVEAADFDPLYLHFREERFGRLFSRGTGSAG